MPRMTASNKALTGASGQAKHDAPQVFRNTRSAAGLTINKIAQFSAADAKSRPVVTRWFLSENPGSGQGNRSK
jgi:hypothetical protein